MSTSVVPGQYDLNGSIELHCELPDARYLAAADELGITDLVIKWPGGADSAPLASTLNSLGSKNIRLWGGVVLDTTVGGLNAAAARSSAESGGSFVWMPTVDAKYHRKINGQPKDGAICLFAQHYEPLPELLATLDVIAEKKLVLGTGHISPDETEALIDLANEKGVRQVIVNHPLLLGANLESLKRITRYKNVMIEHCYVPFHKKAFDVQRIIEAIEAVPPNQSVIADFGDFGNDANIADALVAQSVDAASLRLLTVTNPKSVLGNA